MSKKGVYLFLALLLPGLIFVFLKFFGKNEFEIPVYYENGVVEVPDGCLYAKGPYHVPDSILMNWNWNGSSILVSIGGLEAMHQLNRIISDAQVENLQIVNLQDGGDQIKTCILLMKAPWDVVLIDSQRRIRGYYKTGHRDDMDRLEVELKILLKRY